MTSLAEAMLQHPDFAPGNPDELMRAAIASAAGKLRTTETIRPVTLNRKVAPVFKPLQKPCRYKGADGGRASGKSHFFGEEAVDAMVRDKDLRFVCIREIQKSLEFSAKSLVEAKIVALGVEHLFEVQQRKILRRNGTGVMIFEGMQDHTSDSIKSLEGFGRAWVEEAQSISPRSLDLLLPTIRLEGSEIWFSWNPEQPTDAVDRFFATTGLGKVRVTSTYRDNPFCPKVMREEAQRLEIEDPEAFQHIWLGGYFLGGSGRVYSSFKNRPFPEGNVDEAVKDLGGELLIGQDFNVNPMATILACRAVDECHIFDALQVNTSNTEEVCQEIRRRYPKRKVIVCPDASGKARHTNAPVGQTDFTIMQQYGFEVRAPAANPPVVDRINNAQRMLLHEGRRRTRIHPKAVALITALSNLTYKEGTSIQDKKTGFDHVCDAAGYLLWQEFNVLTEKPKWGASKWKT